MHLEEAVEKTSMNDKLQEIVDLKLENEAIEKDLKYLRENSLKTATHDVRQLDDLLNIFFMVVQYNTDYETVITLGGTGFISVDEVQRAYNDAVKYRKGVEKDIDRLEANALANNIRIREIQDEMGKKNQYQVNKVMWK